MKILYVADGRSPITLNWIGYFIRTGHEVHLASTFPCKPINGLTSSVEIPVAMSGVYRQADTGRGTSGRILRNLLPVGLRTRIRQMIAPLTLPQATDALREVIERVQPEIIHAMRIPFEGMIAGKSLRHNVQAGGKAWEIPLLVSVWGNDFTLHAKSSPLMAYYTRQTLKHCHALHTDCQRDLNLAKAQGFATDKPAIVLPGGGGIDLEVFHPAEEIYDEHGRNYLSMEDLRVRIINPRGFRAYVRNDTFFHAIPMVLQRYLDAHFVCPGMAGEAQALKWVAELEIGEHVDLLPSQSMQGMAELFRKSQISLSITTHDGTPNTLLEAFACGCFPIAGDIEALREWITPGENGLLVDPGDPQALSAAILSAISQPELRKKAREINLELVNERAEYGMTMHRAEEFYNQLLFSYS